MAVCQYPLKVNDGKNGVPEQEPIFCLILCCMEKIDPKKLDKAVALYEGGFSIRQAADISGISKSAIQREIAKRDVSRSKLEDGRDCGQSSSENARAC